MALTFGEMRSRLLKLPYGAGVDLDVLDGIINDRLEEYIRAFPWTRLVGNTYLTVVAVYETGTLAVSSGGTALTGTGTVWTSAMTGRRIRIANRPEFYDFTYVSATSATINVAYEGDTETAASYKIWKNIYELPSDMGTLETIKVPNLNADLDQIDPELLDEIAPSRDEYGRPELYALTQDTSGGEAQVELYPIPEEAESFPLRYTKRLDRMDDGADTFAEWISTAAIQAGAEADLMLLHPDYAGGFATKEAKWQEFLSKAKAEDCRRMQPTQMRMADRFTSHRQDRVLGWSRDDERRRKQMP